MKHLSLRITTILILTLILVGSKTTSLLLKKDTSLEPAAKLSYENKILEEQWRKEYNTTRPHSSLGYRPPAPETFEPMPSVSAMLQLTA
jgi:hypothetical protein